MRIQLVGAEQAIQNLTILPPKVAFKHLRIALNAAGGRIAKSAAALAQRDTGLLAKSIGVKVKIPDASWDIKHHGKPAYTVVGPKRNSGRMLRVGKHRTRGHGKAQRTFQGQLRLLRGTTIGNPRRAAIARGFVRSVFGSEARFRNPSRYAHLVEKGHAKGRGHYSARAYPFMAPAARIAGPQALKAMADKLARAFELEAFSLSKFRTGKIGVALGGIS